MTTNNENQPEMKAAEPVAAAPVNLDTFDWEAYEHDSNLYGESKEEIAAKYDQTLSNRNRAHQARSSGQHRLQVGRHHSDQRIQI